MRSVSYYPILSIVGGRSKQARRGGRCLLRYSVGTAASSCSRAPLAPCGSSPRRRRRPQRYRLWRDVGLDRKPEEHPLHDAQSNDEANRGHGRAIVVSAATVLMIHCCGSYRIVSYRIVFSCVRLVSFGAVRPCVLLFV